MSIFFKVKIIPCKTVRDKNKVPLSSRNILLKKTNLALASKIYKRLINIKNNINNQKNISKFLIYHKKKIENDLKTKIDYLELRSKKDLKISKKVKNSKLFIAYYIKEIRLIDNI